MFAFVVLSQFFVQGFPLRLFFLRVDCECNRLSFLATAFTSSKFNGDLKQWNVAKVTDMRGGKSIRIVENDVKSCYCYWRVHSGV
jgi:hypothetical protein